MTYPCTCDPPASNVHLIPQPDCAFTRAAIGAVAFPMYADEVEGIAVVVSGKAVMLS